ncbi:uncharacterized protein [Amphiura filiformis]|uniref:uncharacterized protein n=1 Tax=Amphiura filiformis TaxID=82378 RepID=UPI003B224990
MAMPRPKQPIYAAGYYRPKRFRPMHFLPPMKVKLDDDSTNKSPRNQKSKIGYNGATTLKETGRRGRYKNMIMTLACNLTMENVSDIKFLCKEHVHPPGLLDKIRYPRDLITRLENQRLLAENNLYFIQTMLYYISRLDLYELVLDFRVENQKEYRERGVDIKAVYDLRNDSSERATLAQELFKFRRDLKPRSRLQRADVNGLRNRLHELTTKMHDHVSEIQQTTAAKFKLLHDGVELPPITTTGGAGQEDRIDSDSGGNDEVVVKLKLCDRYDAKDFPKPEHKVRRKRSRIPSERLSMGSSASITSQSTSMPIRIMVPNVSYEQDERLRLTPHTEKGKTEPAEEEVFRYTTPIPPPRSETLSTLGKVTQQVTMDKQSKKRKKRVKISEQLPEPSMPEHSSEVSSKTTVSGEECGHDSPGADLDTQHLSNAIQKLRKKMGIKTRYSQDNFHAFQRTVPHKTKRRRKDGYLDHSKASLQRSKGRKLKEKAAKLPDIYDNFARHTSSSKVQYMNILK